MPDSEPIGLKAMFVGLSGAEDGLQASSRPRAAGDLRIAIWGHRRNDASPEDDCHMSVSGCRDGAGEAPQLLELARRAGKAPPPRRADGPQSLVPRGMVNGKRSLRQGRETS